MGLLDMKAALHQPLGWQRGMFHWTEISRRSEEDGGFEGSGGAKGEGD
jgi:hypothetical protein